METYRIVLSFRAEPVEAHSLKDKIADLAQECGVEAVDVWLTETPVSDWRFDEEAEYVPISNRVVTDGPDTDD